MQKTRLSAFTILEVMIVMLLLSVVVAMSYSVFRIIKGYERGLNKRNLAQNSVLLVSTVFKNDLRAAIYVKDDMDSSVVFYNVGNMVAYHIVQDLLIRDDGVKKDTLFDAPDIHFEYAYTNNRQHPDYIDQLTLVLQDSTKRALFISESKLYSSSELFNDTGDGRN